MVRSNVTVCKASEQPCVALKVLFFFFFNFFFLCQSLCTALDGSVCIAWVATGAASSHFTQLTSPLQILLGHVFGKSPGLN